MRIEIWSDLVCPWCYIGKRRFEQALAAFAHRDEVTVLWRSFELDPAAPRDVDDLLGHLAAKYGLSREEAEAMVERVTRLAAAEGLEYRLETARRGNTFDAHRLLQLAGAHGVQDALAERLMRGYFSEAEAIGDPAVLARLAVEVGLPPREVNDVLAGDRYADAVRADEQDARALGATGVPFFVADRMLAVSGAQPIETFAALLEQAWTHAREVQPDEVSGPPGKASGSADSAR